ncbi:hypothetical protein DFJ77DRAFT_443384 [Powellomyces hirtus]|nr:hypothetical protein DFJ77DRAFT_443384 [Powellomyces hirtus]
MEPFSALLWTCLDLPMLLTLLQPLPAHEPDFVASSHQAAEPVPPKSAFSIRQAGRSPATDPALSPSAQPGPTSETGFAACRPPPVPLSGNLKGDSRASSGCGYGIAVGAVEHSSMSGTPLSSPESEEGKGRGQKHQEHRVRLAHRFHYTNDPSKTKANLGPVLKPLDTFEAEYYRALTLPNCPMLVELSGLAAKRLTTWWNTLAGKGCREKQQPCSHLSPFYKLTSPSTGKVARHIPRAMWDPLPQHPFCRRPQRDVVTEVNSTLPNNFPYVCAGVEHRLVLDARDWAEQGNGYERYSCATDSDGEIWSTFYDTMLYVSRPPPHSICNRQPQAHLTVVYKERKNKESCRVSVDGARSQESSTPQKRQAASLEAAGIAIGTAVPLAVLMKQEERAVADVRIGTNWETPKRGLQRHHTADDVRA